MDQNRIRLEAKISEVQANCRGKTEVATKAMDEVRELKNIVKALKVDAIEKDTRLDHLQKGNNELRTLLKKAKEDAVEEFKASSQFTVLLERNYATGFEEFHLDPEELFPKVDFSSIKLNIGAASFLLQTSFEDVNIEDDATLPGLLRTSLILEITLSERCLKYYLVIFPPPPPFFYNKYEVCCFGPLKL